MNALELAQEHARLALVHAQRLPALPERALVESMAQRLVDELAYFAKAQAWRARS